MRRHGGLVVAIGAVVMAAACSGKQVGIPLRAVDGSAVKATAYLQEVTGPSGRVISARMDVEDPGGRALAGALIEGRCAAPGRFVDNVPISTSSGHFRGSTPRKIAALRGGHAIVVAEADVTETAVGAPVACADL